MHKTIEVQYKIWINDQDPLHNTFEIGESESIPIDKLMPGWREGALLIGKGGMIEMDIPPDLAFGIHGRPPENPTPSEGCMS